MTDEERRVTASTNRLLIECRERVTEGESLSLAHQRLILGLSEAGGIQMRVAEDETLGLAAQLFVLDTLLEARGIQRPRSLNS